MHGKIFRYKYTILLLYTYYTVPKLCTGIRNIFIFPIYYNKMRVPFEIVQFFRFCLNIIYYYTITVS